jgi:hypothetical protein
MSMPGPLLEYGLGEPTTRRRRRRLAYAAIVLALIAGAALLLRPRWQPRVERWAHFREIAQSVASLEQDDPPAGTVAFEEDANKSAVLNDRDGYMRVSGMKWPFDCAARRPNAWYRLAGARVPALGGVTNAFNAVLFAHRLRAASGLTRLVVVEGVADWRMDDDKDFTRVRTVATTLATDGPRHYPLRPLSEWEGQTLKSQRTRGGFGVRVFAGHADPADPSHFTIDFETGDGRKGTIDGWLRDERPYGERVDMRLRP